MKYIIWGFIGFLLLAVTLPFIKEGFTIIEANDEIDAPVDYEK